MKPMDKDNHVLLTVFTPTYNRAHTLQRTYESLLRQECKEFIWLVVDDGSTDQTAQLVRQWQKCDNGFAIRYYHQENGGMHTAHNAAYALMDTMLNICVDSDDILVDCAVRRILEKWRQVENDGYAGIVGLDADLRTGQIIGAGFPPGLTETTLNGYYARGGCGDKKLVYRTEVMRSYPDYPVFPGENYVSLGYKYLLCDQDYQLAVLDEVLCGVEYRADGSSRNMLRQYYRNPRGFAFWRRVKMTYPTSFGRLVLDCIHYCSSSILSRDRTYIRTSPYRMLTVLCTLPGLVLAALVAGKGRGA